MSTRMRDDSPGTVTPGGRPAPLGPRRLEASGRDPTSTSTSVPARTGGAEPLGVARLGGSTRLLLALLAAALALYAAVAADVVNAGRLSQFDVDTATWVARSMPPWAEWLARPFTWLGGVVGLTVAAAAAVTWLLRRRAPGVVVLLLVVTIGIQLIVVAAKNGYDRPRPDVGSAIALPSSFSFPSGHAANGIAVFGLLGLIAGWYARSRRERVAAIVAGFVTGIFVGLSRVVLDVHYLSDVVAGACLGLAWLTACLLAARGADAYRARDRSRPG